LTLARSYRNRGPGKCNSKISATLTSPGNSSLSDFRLGETVLDLSSHRNTADAK
jgi:hypothetical protein